MDSCWLWVGVVEKLPIYWLIWGGNGDVFLVALVKTILSTL